MWHRFKAWWDWLAPPPPSVVPLPPPPLPEERWLTGEHQLVFQRDQWWGRCWSCTCCQGSWRHRPKQTCPGVSRWTWATQPPDARSLLALWREGVQPRAGPCGYRLTTPARGKDTPLPPLRTWLYAKQDVLPHRVVTLRQQELARQQAGVAEREDWVTSLPAHRVERFTARCAACGQVFVFIDDERWCGACAAAHQELVLLRRYDRVRQWAQALLATPNWRLLTVAATGPGGTTARLSALTLVDAAGQVLFETLVQPGKSIGPVSGTRYQIQDANVALAPRFSTIFPHLLPLLGDGVLLAFPVAFVRPLLEHEAWRHGVVLPPITWDCVQRKAWAMVAQCDPGDDGYQHLRTDPHTPREQAMTILALLHRLAQGL